MSLRSITGYLSRNAFGIRPSAAYRISETTGLFREGARLARHAHQANIKKPQISLIPQIFNDLPVMKRRLQEVGDSEKSVASV